MRTKRFDGRQGAEYRGQQRRGAGDDQADPDRLQPVDGDARLCNLHLTMLQRMGVQAESFGDSVRTLSEIVA